MHPVSLLSRNNKINNNIHRERNYWSRGGGVDSLGGGQQAWRSGGGVGGVEG